MSEQENKIIAEVAKQMSPDVEKLKEAMRASKQLLGQTLQMDARTAPIVRGLELVERELQRTHSTIQILAANKCSVDEQLEALTELREDFRDALQAYVAILKTALKESIQV